MTATPAPYQARLVRPDAVQWDGTWNGYQSIASWLDGHGIDHVYTPAVGDADPIFDLGDATVGVHDWILVDVTQSSSARHTVLADALFSALFDALTPPERMFADGATVKYAAPGGNGDETMVGTVKSAYFNWDENFWIYDVDWPGFQIDEQTHSPAYSENHGDFELVSA